MPEAPITVCIGTSNNLEYLKLAVHSVRKYSHFKDIPIFVHAENCSDGTDEWLLNNNTSMGITSFVDHHDEEHTLGIGGGMNFLAERVKTEFIMFMHADMFATPDWDINALKVFDKYPKIPMWVSSYRIQPNVFNENSRPGTLIVPTDYFGEFAHNFDEASFIEYAKDFVLMNDFEIRKGEGVSGLIRKKDWDFIGGNDPRFNPLSYEDMDLFIRMQNAGYKFVLTSKSVVYHFGSRSANGHFVNGDISQRSSRQSFYEQRNFQRFVEKWGQPPQHDNVGFVKPIREKKGKPTFLVCLVHFGCEGQLPGGHQREYFLQVLAEYNKAALKYDITLHVFLTEDTIDWSAFPNLNPIKHIFPESITNRLPREHKAIMIENAGKFDYYLYSEDDILITPDHLDAFVETKLPMPYVPSFLRYELKPGNPYKFLFDIHPANGCHRGGNVPIKETHIINGEKYLEPYNIHSGCYLVTNEQFEFALKNGYANDFPWYAKGPMESVASNIYWNCGLIKVIPKKNIERWVVHHLSDRYVNMLPHDYTEELTPCPEKL